MLSAFRLSRALVASGFVFVLVVSAAANARAQAPTSGWRMPNLNPFAGKSSAPASNGGRSTVAKVVDPFGLIPGTGGKTSTASWNQTPQQPTTWQRMTSGTKKMADGTKKMASQTADFLNPFDDGADQPAQNSYTGSNSAFNRQANKRPVQQATEKQGWFPGLNTTQGTEEKPSSVNGFLSQKRPMP